jgi:valyl-tRNA synthetase
MPFVAESIWQALAEHAFERGLPSPEPATESIVIAPWPQFPPSWKDPAMEQRIARMQELVRFVREVRNRYQLDAKLSLDVSVRCSDTLAQDYRSLGPFITLLAGVGSLECGPSQRKPAQAAGHVHPEFEAYVSLQGLIDVEKETKRLQKLLGEKSKQLQTAEAKLSNASFVDKAPADVVQQQKNLVASLEEQIKIIESNLKDLRQQ